MFQLNCLIGTKRPRDYQPSTFALPLRSRELNFKTYIDSWQHTKKHFPRQERPRLRSWVVVLSFLCLLGNNLINISPQDLLRWENTIYCFFREEKKNARNPYHKFAYHPKVNPHRGCCLWHHCKNSRIIKLLLDISIVIEELPLGKREKPDHDHGWPNNLSDQNKGWEDTCSGKIYSLHSSGLRQFIFHSTHRKWKIRFCIPKFTE